MPFKAGYLNTRLEIPRFEITRLEITRLEITRFEITRLTRNLVVTRFKTNASLRITLYLVTHNHLVNNYATKSFKVKKKKNDIGQMPSEK